MNRSLLPEHVLNGGFPEPPANEPIRVIAARHAACGEATRVRLPGAVPARVVRRLRCSGCRQTYETEQVQELGLERPEPVTRQIAAVAPPVKPPAATAHKPSTPPAPARKRRRLNPQSRTWKLASIPIAGALVIAALVLLQGGSDDPSPSAPSEATAAGAQGIIPDALEDANGSGAKASAPPDDPNVGGDGSQKTKLVRGSSYSLALPQGWEQIEPPTGATFAAASSDGGADATLWIEEDAELDFPTFINQSLRQLESLAGSARVVERVPAPSPDATIVRLAADAPAGRPSYVVTLRAAGPYRYYLATSVQPDASQKAVKGADLVAGSFTPEGSG